ncbi:MAG TPA: cyclic nucleotide-binding domain-containing protein [Pseudomonadales bacterium]|nr:cyclic nucleotide-binding domain-containing protein [Pseudomonadales bacterium]
MAHMPQPIDSKTLRRFVPFDSLSETYIRDVIRLAKVVKLPSGRNIFRRNQITRTSFYLLSGKVEMLDAENRISTVNAESRESRYALDNAQPHSMSATAVSEVTLLSVDRDQLDLVLTWDQAGNYLVQELTQENPVEPCWMSNLLASNLLAQVPPANIQSLFQKFTPQKVYADQVIIREGEPGDWFYVIQEGKAVVSRSNTPTTRHILAELIPGQFFGEEALVSDSPRNATVTMKTAGVLMKLDKDYFKKLLQEPVLHYINVEKLSDLSNSGTKIQVVDVRLPLEFNHDPIVPGALNIPLAELRNRLQTLPNDTTYVVTCDGGRRSELGAYLFNETGRAALVCKPSARPTH